MRMAAPEMQSLEREVKSAAQLLVEGRSAEMFFREMVRNSGLADAIDVRSYGDNSSKSVRTWLDLFLKKPSVRERVHRIGLIRDAEAAPARDAFESLCSILRDLHLDPPPRPGDFAGHRPQCGIYVLPDSVSSGMLEDLCLTAIAEQPSAAGLLRCVETLADCRSKSGHGSPKNASKFRLAGYLLVRDVLDPQLGRAAQQGVIPWTSKAFDPIRRFLQDLAAVPAD